MATFVNTIPRQGAEDQNIDLTAFAQLLKAIKRLYDAEKDVVGLPAGDPAFDGWLRMAERCRVGVSEAAEHLAETADGCDWGEIGRLVALMLSEFDPENYAHHVREIDALTSEMARDSRNPLPFRQGNHILQFRRVFALLLSLPDYSIGAEAHKPAQVFDQAA